MDDKHIGRYPEAPLKMYRVTFTMKRRGGPVAFMTAIFPAVSKQAAMDVVPGMSFEISEATNNLYVSDGNRQTVSVFEVEQARVFTENVNAEDA